jgi:hypothetical protein
MSGIVGSRLNIRGSGIVGSIGTDGQVLTSSGAGQEMVFEDAAGGGKILQVVTASTTTNANITSNSYTDTNLTADITPSATSSKIFICGQQTNFNSGHTDVRVGYRLLRDSTELWKTGFSSSSTILGLYDNTNFSGTINLGYLLSIQWVDSPSSTSALTYKTQMVNGNNTSGYTGTQNNMGDGVTAGHITLLEIDGS